MAMDFFLQPNFDQRLVRDIARVGRRFDGIQKVLWQTQRYGLCRGLQVGQRYLLGFRPVQVRCGIVGLPVRPLVFLAGEFGRGFQWGFSLFGHK